MSSAPGISVSTKCTSLEIKTSPVIGSQHFQLVVNRISKKYTLPGLGLKGRSLVLLHMSIGSAAKDMKMGESDYRRLHRESYSRVQQRGIDLECAGSRGPKLSWKMRMGEEGSDTFI